MHTHCGPVSNESSGDYLNYTRRKGQDGRGVGGRGVHLTPQRHQEHIYQWNNSHRALAEH